MAYNDGISRRQFVKVGSGAAAAALVAGLAGCSSGSGSAAASGSASASASGSASAASGSGAAARTITDIKGDAVEIPGEINTIVDLWHAHNQVIMMLGAADKLIGTTEVFKKRPWPNGI